MRYGDMPRDIRVTEDVMAACNPYFHPSCALQFADEVPAVHGGYSTYQTRLSTPDGGTLRQR
jgi:hypothetical protein